MIRTADRPISGGAGETVHNTSGRPIERLLTVRLPPPLFMIRFR
jgi:hypothetical protein